MRETSELRISDLNEIYREAEEVDKKQFVKMRSNILLAAGDHYTKNVNRNAQNITRVRENTKLTTQTKLRLTQNHIYRIVKTYANSILSKVPGVRPTPKNESEMQDRKDAELNDAVWQDAKDRHKINYKARSWVEQFVGVSEFALKVYWDPEKGDHVGYEALVDEMGQPVVEEAVDEYGQVVVQPVLAQVPDKNRPVMTGDYCYEEIPCYNLMRDPEATTMEDSPYLIIRKFVKKKALREKYPDENKSKFVDGNPDEKFIIFDSSRYEYRAVKDECVVKEMYYRPCRRYPNGYYYVFTQAGILEQGELPYGIFPIVWAGFDEYVSTPRARSIVEVARPYQAEINRAASQEATHQVTLGDDKVLYQSGSKLAQGALLPGVRGIAYNGVPPTILPGRNGSQFGEYVQRKISDMYRACLLDEVMTEKSMQLEPHSLLYRSMSQKSIFVPYIMKWERFMQQVCELTLEVARHYLPDEKVIAAIGRNEQVNLPEFRNTKKLCYDIKLESVSDDAETLLGKQINFQHILQYVGNQLDPKDVGKILKNMPYVNNEDNFSDLTIDEDNVTNDMLAIERGEMPSLNPHDDNIFYIKKLTHRMKQPDFVYLQPQVQQIYQQFLQIHMQEEARKAEEIKRAQQGFIPTDGALIACDMYVENKEDPTKAPKRARVPQKAMAWLMEQMEIQGDTMDQLESLERSSLAQLAGQINQPQVIMPVR